MVPRHQCSESLQPVTPSRSARSALLWRQPTSRGAGRSMNMLEYQENTSERSNGLVEFVPRKRALLPNLMPVLWAFLRRSRHLPGKSPLELTYHRLGASVDRRGRLG